MQRGSDRVNVHLDDEIKKEMHGRLHSGHPTRAQQEKDPEPGADDDSWLAERPQSAGSGRDSESGEAETEAEELRSDLARHLGRTAFPADRRTLVRTLLATQAPDDLVDTVRTLPHGGEEYRTVQEVVVALGHHPRA
ncbi:hypothetical protein AN216_08250 [Streptomyces oceani]|uniref:DUF2795 domain-containing protein n=2 Tax=Streptomyces oceani TaxID=1075402 RepID=A0A1E7KKE9_9ACTN|nr:hypothetical protein AN216_08250 [Streptomyces oceani]